MPDTFNDMSNLIERIANNFSRARTILNQKFCRPHMPVERFFKHRNRLRERFFSPELLRRAKMRHHIARAQKRTAFEFVPHDTCGAVFYTVVCGCEVYVIRSMNIEVFYLVFFHLRLELFHHFRRKLRRLSSLWRTRKKDR